MTGVDGAFKCGAEDKEAASDVGLNVPFSRMPLACASGKCELMLRPRVSLMYPYLVCILEVSEKHPSNLPSRLGKFG